MATASRTDRIMRTIYNHTKKFDIRRIPESLQPLQIPDLARELGIAANNISTLLTQQFKNGSLIRVGGRPTAYLSAPELESVLRHIFPTNQFDSRREFVRYLGGITTAAAAAAAGEKTATIPDVTSSFDTLIGSEASLQIPVRQAKSAMLYPPAGLHTLITGPTGVGKSLFANCMYDYAIKSKTLARDAAIVHYNCANYSDNPQLLLSQLFGYVKGAFTGAAADKPGLVEYANGGILFLDEIHRLNHEGQEKLFMLIDSGTFRRLGETETLRRARVVIIGATTEDPGAILLSAFLRRIPVKIELPSLAERSVAERLEFIFYFIWQEARNVKKRILIEPEIVDILLRYDCPNNIGQLAMDIKLACSGAYYDCLIGHEPDLRLKTSNLSAPIYGRDVSGPGQNGGIRPGNLLIRAGEAIVINGSKPFPELFRQYVPPR